MLYDVSVVVPTFNVELYIEETLKSVINQTFKGSIELIVIDDCSTDSTPNIVKNFKHSNEQVPIKILYQEKNMRQGTARNLGISEAKGKYIFFLDGDDFIEPNAISKMYEKAEEQSCDFVLCDWTYYYKEKGLVYVNNDLFLFKDYLVGNECEELYQAGSYFTVNKLYNRNFLINNDIKYGEGYIYEDIEFYVKVANCAKLVGIVHNPYYRVRVNEYSTTKTNLRSTEHIDSFIKAVKETIRCFEPRNDSSYYHLNKYLVNKSIFYAEKRAPRGHKKNTLKKVIKLLNSKKTNYFVPNNIIPLNNLLFKRKLVQNEKYNTILLAYWLHNKGQLSKLFHLAKGTKQRLLNLKAVKLLKNSKWYNRLKQNKIELERSKYYEEPLENNTILFLGFDYKYIGNSKYLFDYLRENSKGLKLLFVTKDKSIPLKYRIAPRSKQFYRVLAKAKIVIGESWIPIDFHKRNDSIWIQLWHGTPFKKLLFDSHEKHISNFNRNHKKQKQKDIRRWDYLLADSNHAAVKFTSCFDFNKNKILNYGYPRVQWLKDNKDNKLLKSKIRLKLGLPNDKKVVLYAPTWRDYNYKEKNLDFSYLMNIEYVSKKLSEYVILYKPHSMEKVKKFNESVIILDDTVEVQNFLLVADIIISDYSSIIFDGMAIDIPFYLFINDFNRYQKARGVYKDMHKLLQSFYINNEGDLINKLQNVEYPIEQYTCVKNLYSNIYENNANEELMIKISSLSYKEKLYKKGKVK